MLSIPSGVYKMVEKITPNFNRFIKKIKVVLTSSFIPATRFEKTSKVVVIEFTPGKRRIYGVLTFVHELGYALSILKCVDKGMDPYKKTRY